MGNLPCSFVGGFTSKKPGIDKAITLECAQDKTREWQYMVPRTTRHEQIQNTD